VRQSRRIFPEIRQTVVGLLLLPFLFVALLPQGYMPTLTENGTFTVTLCTTDGLRTITLDASGNEIPEAPGDREEKAAGPCLFASVGQFAVLHSAPDLPAVRRAGLQQTVFVPGGFQIALLSGRLGARAPPA